MEVFSKNDIDEQSLMALITYIGQMNHFRFVRGEETKLVGSQETYVGVKNISFYLCSIHENDLVNDQNRKEVTESLVFR